jgi:hypothetical protein
MERVPLATIRRRRSTLARIVLAIASIFLACLFIEALCWVCLRLTHSKRPVGRWEFRSSRPAPYQNAVYFNDQFLQESMHCARLEQVSGAGFMIPGDCTGRYCNVRSGKRRTTYQPAVWKHRLLLFGGSTLFSQEVPDRWTVASCLQRLLNQQPGQRWLVENYGTCSMCAAQQTERLQQIQVRAGDLVVFYDGVNDVVYPIYNANPGGWHPGDAHDGGVYRLSALQRWLYPLCLAHKKHSATARLLLRALEHQLPHNVADHATFKHNLRAAEKGFRKALLEAHQTAARLGARFVHFLQPNLFTMNHRSCYERRLLENDLQTLPGLDQAFALGYPSLRAAIHIAAGEGVRSFDLSEVLDERAQEEEFYLDFCHVNHAANARIAQAIFERTRSQTHAEP